MITLLLAAAGCSCADVVSILKKGRVDLEECVVEVSGLRREAEPRRYVSLHFKFRLRGAGLDLAKAERAVQLSLQKYCSVVHSLAPDIVTDYEIQLA
jgi:putative redox protein